MPENRKSKDNNQEKHKRSFMEFFLTREEPDKDYLQELKAQWNTMDNGERVKFALGMFLGIIIVMVGLFLIYFVISAMWT